MTGSIKALTGEFIRRLSKTMPLTLPMIIVAPMALEGVFWIADLQMAERDIDPLSWHVVYVALGFMLMAVPLCEAYKGLLQRLYVLPVSNGFIAGWMMVSAIVAILSQELLVHWLYGFTLADWSYLAILGDNRSLIGPCQVIFASAISMLMAMHWSLRNFKFRKLLACFVLLILFIFWVASHYFPGGFDFGWECYTKAEPWTTFSVVDGLIILSIIAASSVITYRGVVRDRCGDNVGHSFQIRVEAITARLMAIVFPDRSRSHDSPEIALAWHEWRSRGRDAALACGIALGILVALMAFLGGSNRGRHPVVDITLLFLVPGVLGLLVGSVLGVLAPTSSREGMTNFLATTPVSDARLARGLLRNAFRTTLIAWVLVLIPGMLALVVSFFYRGGTSHFLIAVGRLNGDPDFQLGMMTIPCLLIASFLLAWTLTAVLAVLHWTGSRYLGPVILVAGIADFTVMFLLRFLVTEKTYTIVLEATFGLVAGVIVVGSVLAFRVALKRKMIEPASATLLLSIWLFESLLCCFFVPTPAMYRIFLSGILSLSVSPVALAPLALSRNRHAA